VWPMLLLVRVGVCVCVSSVHHCPACYMLAALFRGFLHHIPHVQAMFALLVAFCKYATVSHMMVFSPQLTTFIVQCMYDIGY
jgi:hypothetical protein